MKKKGLYWTIFIFALIGVLFSGYMTFVKLFSGVCPITEGCAILLGYPVCIYGLIMFFILFVLICVRLFGVRKKDLESIGGVDKGLFYVSLIGFLFSLYFSIKELFFNSCGTIFSGNCHYSLGVPSCVYGFVMYLIIFICAVMIKKKKR
ncbi:MAG: hypothetical protein WC796_01520 [Candidatus Pacearchaeota archaeon]|jgi:hypothetical protein